MTYTEWRDELKSNLLCVSENERRRVLEYYAEAYADRRDAGFSEREIIEEFGAPYDAAKRILSEEDREAKSGSAGGNSVAPAPLSLDEANGDPCDPDTCADAPKRGGAKRENGKGGRTSWVFVLLCVIFALPIFLLVLALGIVTVVSFVAPLAVLAAGIGETGLGVGMLFSSVPEGLLSMGVGLILFGTGVILIAVLPRIAKFFRFIFKRLGGFIKSLFTAKEA